MKKDFSNFNGFYFEKLTSMIAENDIFILSDYDKGTLDDSKQIMGELTKWVVRVSLTQKKRFRLIKGPFL